MDSEALNKLVIDALEDMKAQDIAFIDVTGRTSVYRYYGNRHWYLQSSRSGGCR